MPLAGFTAAQGELSIVLVVVAGSVGSLAGALLWYYVGRWVGARRLKRFASRHGRWLTLSPGEVDDSCRWFNRHGHKAVFLGRMVPAVRTLISVPAGIASVPLLPFLIASALGTVLWTALLAAAGYLLQSQYEAVGRWLDPVSNGVIVLLLVWYVWRVASFGRERGQSGRIASRRHDR